MEAKISKDTLCTLAEIKRRGYIHPRNNGIRSYFQKMNHVLAEFLKNTPVNPKDSLECMDYLVEISKSTPTFFSLFPETMLDLYDWAITGENVTQRQAETKLLFFFSQTPPLTIEQKKRLLYDTLKMPDFTLRKREISKVTNQLINHYSKNQQFNEDPGLSVLTLLSDVLHFIDPFSKSSHNGIAKERASFYKCASVIKKHAPELCEDSWLKNFAPRTHQKFFVPDVKEPMDVFVQTRRGTITTNFSKGWELD